LVPVPAPVLPSVPEADGSTLRGRLEAVARRAAAAERAGGRSDAAPAALPEELRREGREGEAEGWTWHGEAEGAWCARREGAAAFGAADAAREVAGLFSDGRWLEAAASAAGWAATGNAPSRGGRSVGGCGESESAFARVRRTSRDGGDDAGVRADRCLDAGDEVNGDEAEGWRPALPLLSPALAVDAELGRAADGVCGCGDDACRSASAIRFWMAQERCESRQAGLREGVSK
jgi:hypothetical protein